MNHTATRTENSLQRTDSHHPYDRNDQFDTKVLKRSNIKVHFHSLEAARLLLCVSRGENEALPTAIEHLRKSAELLAQSLKPRGNIWSELCSGIDSIVQSQDPRYYRDEQYYNSINYWINSKIPKDRPYITLRGIYRPKVFLHEILPIIGLLERIQKGVCPLTSRSGEPIDNLLGVTAARLSKLTERL